MRLKCVKRIDELHFIGTLAALQAFFSGRFDGLYGAFYMMYISRISQRYFIYALYLCSHWQILLKAKARGSSLALMYRS